MTTHLTPHAGHISAADRARLLGQTAQTLWFTGLSGAGKSTLAYALELALHRAGRAVYVLDGDNIRHGLNRDLGFSPEARQENIRRIAEVARLMNDAGLIVLTAFISPFAEDRAQARTIIGPQAFREIYVSTPLPICEARDPKGLYRLARSGQLPQFTGVSSPYEPPPAPELKLDTTTLSVEEAVLRLTRLVLADAPPDQADA